LRAPQWAFSRLFVWYIGLSSPEQHIARVRARVAKGGHDIAEERIRERYARSLLNLIRLIRKLTELRLFDNSVEADPQQGAAPEPSLILHLEHHTIRNACEPAAAPEWCKPILLAALQLPNT
jgi:predicted ABC-type ATPase